METKLLHDRLRGCTIENECTINVLRRVMGMPTLSEEYDNCGGRSCVECRIEHMRLLADEIDRQYIPLNEARHLTSAPLSECVAHYTGFPAKDGESIKSYLERNYIPRPRYKDGEPVQFGDMVDFDGNAIDVNDVVLHLDGSGYCLMNHTSCTTVPIDEPAKRPAPKALDADGMETKAGDTVWLLISGVKGTVKSVGAATGTAYVEWDDGSIYPGLMMCSCITHREPDSLEKLRDDMLDEIGTREDFISQMIHCYADRLTALIERGA